MNLLYSYYVNRDTRWSKATKSNKYYEKWLLVLQQTDKRKKNKMFWSLWPEWYTLSLSPIAWSLTLSPFCGPVVFHLVKFPSDQKAAVEREIKMCNRFYLYKWKMEQKRKILAQFLCDIIHYMLLMFDLWHSLGGIGKGSGSGRCGASEIDVVKCHSVPHKAR